MFQSVIVAILAFSGTAFASNLTTVCGKSTTMPVYEYCVHTTPGSTNTELMYFMHGLGEQVQSWEGGPVGRGVRAAWQAQGKDAPTVVTVSYGRMWFLAQKNDSAISGLYEDFIGRVIPEIEGQVLKQTFAKRLLFGESMGGYNASKLYLGHPELFSRAVLACPALVDVSPYASADDQLAYQQRNHVTDKTMGFLQQVGRNYWPSAAVYDADAPVNLARVKLNDSYPPVHVSCGDVDEYGFEEGAKAFADQARDHGVQVTWTLLSGGHCTIDAPAMAKFLLP